MERGEKARDESGASGDRRFGEGCGDGEQVAEGLCRRNAEVFCLAEVEGS